MRCISKNGIVTGNIYHIMPQFFPIVGIFPKITKCNSSRIFGLYRFNPFDHFIEHVVHKTTAKKLGDIRPIFVVNIFTTNIFNPFDNCVYLRFSYRLNQVCLNITDCLGKWPFIEIKLFEFSLTDGRVVCKYSIYKVYDIFNIFDC